MFTSKTNCPVPFEQQPLNEYLSLKRSWLFAWSISSNKFFIFGLSCLFFIFGPFISFLAKFLVPMSMYDFYHNFLLNLLIGDIIAFLFLLRIYLGWSYILKRLLSATIFYEESGWYDGQIWVKNSDYLMQDRLIGLYQVMPFITRIKYACVFTVTNSIFLYFLQFFLDNYSYILYSV
uniref:Ycf36 n=1 Tax=Leptosiphonia brodiei TaxID=2608611 RepID=A0A1Z1MAR9_9FLOR|nr:hypothetical protein [Leptosiphonia brodiei]ARW62921.1 hypothetical protein [Leptosiphonia brodiei]